MEIYQINANNYFTEHDFSEQFVRSSGPGGQNVNKVASAVLLRFDLDNCETLAPHLKVRAVTLAGSRYNKTGEILIQAERFRTQEQNRQDALSRLTELLEKASFRPKPRIATKPSKSARRKRTDSKVKRGSVKQMRGKPNLD